MSGDSKPMLRLSVTIPEEYVSGLEDMAEDMGASLSEAVREVVATYLMNTYWKGSTEKIIRKAILDGASNREALSLVKEENPCSAISVTFVAWYRSKLRTELGKGKVLTDRQTREVFA